MTFFTTSKVQFFMHISPLNIFQCEDVSFINQIDNNYTFYARCMAIMDFVLLDYAFKQLS